MTMDVVSLRKRKNKVSLFKTLKESICIDSLDECPKIKPMPD